MTEAAPAGAVNTDEGLPSHTYLEVQLLVEPHAPRELGIADARFTHGEITAALCATPRVTRPV